MGLLYPDHPDDSRLGLFESGNKRATTRSTNRRSSRRDGDRLVRTPAEPVTTSTTSGELRSLNDLMVRPTPTRRESDRPKKERDDFRDARKHERRERRERHERRTRERTPSPEPKRSSPRKMKPEQPNTDSERAQSEERSRSPKKRQLRFDDEQDKPQVRGPRKPERPRYERTATYEGDRRRESTSPRKRRPSYTDSRRPSSYDSRAAKDTERAPGRQDSRTRYRADTKDEAEPIPAPPPFTRASTAGSSNTSAAVQPTPRALPADVGDEGAEQPEWKASLGTILSESDLQHQPEESPATAKHPPPKRYNTAKDHREDKPKLEREETRESFVSSYLEGSNLENGTPIPRVYRRPSSDDSDLESEYFSNRHSRRPRDSAWDEVEYYKYGQAPEDELPPRRSCCMGCSGWSRRRKCTVVSAAIASLILLIIIIAVGASVENKYDYKPSDAQVTNPQAFQNGGATRNDPNNVDDSTAAPKDEYTYYQGDASNFPDPSKWISFKDMWNGNLNTLQHSCEWLDQGKNNSPQMIQHIFDAIQDRANASLVDHRFIFATILQESNGCPRVGETKSSGGVRNPGLMQSHNGHVFAPKHSKLSMLQMVQDGTQGTEHGDGVVQNMNLHGNPYKAARGYNSGHIPDDGNLSTKSGATKCYVSDLANRLTGWVTAETKCHEE